MDKQNTQLTQGDVKIVDCLPWLADSELSDEVVSGITLDSRSVTAGDLFIAVKGLVVDGRDFIDQAIQNGAKIVFKQSDSRAVYSFSNCWVVDVPGLDRLVSQIAASFYGFPTEHMIAVGVTGTNGKTTVSQLIAQAMKLLGQSSAVIGTAGNGVWPEMDVASHTTPDAVNLQKLMAGYVEQGVDSVAMEVSSHGLDQGRTEHVAFDVAVFTNLTRDHLDYHGTMDAYGRAKARLFEYSGLKASVINLDDPFSSSLLQRAQGKLWTFSQDNSEADVFCEEVELTSQGMRLRVSTPEGKGIIETSLIGHFNVSNVLAVVCVLMSQGVALQRIIDVAVNFQPITGRMETFGGEGKPSAVVDYAHTGDALEKALLAIKNHCRGKLYCVFGCGGDRDRGKRPEMASVAEKLSDFIVVTNDNPRTEDPERIIEEVMSGFASPYLVLVEKDREKAIRLAISQAKPGDWVLVAGKGHEDYQDVQGVKHPFSDVEKVKGALAEYQS